MKIKNKFNASSIVEAMVIMLIIVSWVTWMYNIYSESIHLSVWITNKIQAIQIAKQGIEWITNIRDTNWILFSSDYTNCWNVLNYNTSCIWDTTTNNDIENNSQYIIYNDTDNRWVLDKKTTNLFWSWSYITDFKVWLKDWIYTQSWITDDLKVKFTRELDISYTWAFSNSNDPKMQIKSIVQWVDNTSTRVRKVEMTQLLTNWKK